MEQGTQRRGTGACTFPVHLDAQRFRLVLECNRSASSSESPSAARSLSESASGPDPESSTPRRTRAAAIGCCGQVGLGA